MLGDRYYLQDEICGYNWLVVWRSRMVSKIICFAKINTYLWLFGVNNGIFLRVIWKYF